MKAFFEDMLLTLAKLGKCSPSRGLIAKHTRFFTDDQGQAWFIASHESPPGLFKLYKSVILR